MAMLPPNTPRAVVLLANVAVVAILALLGFGLKFLGPAFAGGVLVGGGAMYVAVRLKYGFWPFEADH